MSSSPDKPTYPQWGTCPNCGRVYATRQESVEHPTWCTNPPNGGQQRTPAARRAAKENKTS